MGIQQMIMAAAGVVKSYFLRVKPLDTSSTTEWPPSILNDPNGSYIIAFEALTGTVSWFFEKLGEAMTVVSRKKWNDGSNSRLDGFCLNASGDIFSVRNADRFCIAKMANDLSSISYSSSYRNLIYSGDQIDGVGITCPGDGYVYAVFGTYNSGEGITASPMIIKVSESTMAVSYAVISSYGVGPVSNMIYVSGGDIWYSGSGSALVKHTVGGSETVYACNQAGTNSACVISQSKAVWDSWDVGFGYVGICLSNVTTPLWSYKYNIPGASNTGLVSSAVEDSSGNIYVTAYMVVSGTNSCVLIKLDSSGNVIWGKSISSSTGVPVISSMTSDGPIIKGHNTNAWSMLVKPSGPTAGTYGSVVITDITLTRSAHTAYTFTSVSAGTVAADPVVFSTTPTLTTDSNQATPTVYFP